MNSFLILPIFIPIIFEYFIILFYFTHLLVQLTTSFVKLLYLGSLIVFVEYYLEFILR